MKLSESNERKNASVFRAISAEDRKGMDNLPGTIDHLMKYNLRTFPVHTEQAAETSEQTVKYVR